MVSTCMLVEVRLQGSQLVFTPAARHEAASASVREARTALLPKPRCEWVKTKTSPLGRATEGGDGSR